MYCRNCGVPMDDNAGFCPRCGCAVDGRAPVGQRMPMEQGDASSGGFAVLGFFFPIVGLILYLVWHQDFPRKARSCGVGALVGVIVEVILIVVWIVLWVCLISTIDYWQVVPLRF